MNTTLEHRKQSILTYLAETQDEVLILQIENLLKPTIDIWDELTEKQQMIIRLGAQQLKEGKKIDYQDFIANSRRAHV
ncbi:MAG: hypothetical protein LH618_20935 [Saprospiraceae bacterium]|nr:hypothetical protein [Saprospiraceae bacterium]